MSVGSNIYRRKIRRRSLLKLQEWRKDILKVRKTTGAGGHKPWKLSYDVSTFQSGVASGTHNLGAGGIQCL